eukprot:scaffold342780_cov81-Attheya_sp.AAC.3
MDPVKAMSIQDSKMWMGTRNDRKVTNRNTTMEEWIKNINNGVGPFEDKRRWWNSCWGVAAAWNILVQVGPGLLSMWWMIYCIWYWAMKNVI